MRNPWGILVVDDDVATLRGLLELFRMSGYRATGAAHLEAAMSLIRGIPFDVLVTDVRLRPDNGLTLLRLAREERPGMAVIVITGFADPAVEEEASRLGATHLLKPLNPRELLAIVADKVAGTNRRRRWPRKRIAGGFAARIGTAPARLVEMSYGGFRLETRPSADCEPSPSLELSLLSFDLSLNAERVWTQRQDSAGIWTCGAALGMTDVKTDRLWRLVVDTLPKQM
jgi:DNA-binding response OmpR family regulator